MSFLKIFNSCCPFLVAHAEDPEDDMADQSRSTDGRYGYELRDLTGDKTAFHKQQVQKFASNNLQTVNDDVLQCMSEFNKNGNNCSDTDPMIHYESISSLVVNDILGQIVY